MVPGWWPVYTRFILLVPAIMPDNQAVTQPRSDFLVVPSLWQIPDPTCWPRPLKVTLRPWVFSHQPSLVLQSSPVLQLLVFMRCSPHALLLALLSLVWVFLPSFALISPSRCSRWCWSSRHCSRCSRWCWSSCLARVAPVDPHIDLLRVHSSPSKPCPVAALLNLASSFSCRSP